MSVGNGHIDSRLQANGLRFRSAVVLSLKKLLELGRAQVAGGSAGLLQGNGRHADDAAVVVDDGRRTCETWRSAEALEEWHGLTVRGTWQWSSVMRCVAAVLELKVIVI